MFEASTRLTMSVTEVAEAIGLSADYVYDLVRAGVLPRVPHTGRKVVIAKQAVVDFVNGNLDRAAS